MATARCASSTATFPDRGAMQTIIQANLRRTLRFLH
jgi:hypothetical protein